MSSESESEEGPPSSDSEPEVSDSPSESSADDLSAPSTRARFVGGSSKQKRKHMLQVLAKVGSKVNSLSYRPVLTPPHCCANGEVFHRSSPYRSSGQQIEHPLNEGKQLIKEKNFVS